MSRRLGQVFLKNKHIQKKIADYVLDQRGDYLVEIGPGTGAITGYIYESCPNTFRMIEIDENLIDDLFLRFPLAEIIHGDFLEVSFDDLDSSKRNILFGNIPYYITSPIILRFLRLSIFEEAIFMVQREYYEVISAKPKTNRYSCISALVQSFVTVKGVLEVGKKNFYPIPKVDSSVVHLIKDKNRDLDIERYSLFLRKCFGMPRKTLWNNLRKHFEKEIVERLFIEKRIEMNIRPEEKESEFFIDLFLYLESERIPS